MGQSVVSLVAQVLESSPFKGRVYQVGGAVRDELLGLPPSGDIDLVVEGDGAAAARLLWDAGAADSPPAVYENFGTAMVQVGGLAIEFVGARKESYRGESRKPAIEPATLLEDAQRRDFTVNALLKRLSDGAVLDLLGTGLADLASGVLRTPLNPLVTFSEDPLRMLRAVRFKSQLGFKFASGLAPAISECADRLQIISPERIQGEIIKMLGLTRAPEAMHDLQSLGLMHQFWPEFDELVGVDQGSFHHLDVWDHTLMVLQNAGHADLLVSLAALFHDIGKPCTRSVDTDGKIRFFTHEVVGAQMTRDMLNRLRFSSDVSNRVYRLVKGHMRLGTVASFSSSAARRLIRDMDEDLERLFAVVKADVGALKPGVKVMDVEAVYELVNQLAVATPRSALASPLNGRELMARYGLSSGPKVKLLKEKLLEAVLDGELAAGDKESAWLLADQLARELLG